MEYLRVAQDLEMYGVNYFEIKVRMRSCDYGVGHVTYGVGHVTTYFHWRLEWIMCSVSLFSSLRIRKALNCG